MRRRWIAMAGVVALLFLGAACREAKRTQNRSAGGGEPARALTDRQASGAAGPAAPSVADQASNSAPDARLAAPAGSQPVPPVPDLAPVGPKIVKTANVELRVPRGTFQARLSEATALAEQLGGFVNASTSTERRGRLSSGTITLRVPADRFQEALGRLRRLGTLTRESEQGDDATREFVDLEARLRQAKSHEAFLLKLMDQAKTISDMIQIQEQLGAVQLRVEELQGQLQYLRDRTSFSAITARLFEPGTTVREPVGLGKAWSSAVDAFVRVIGGLIVAVGWLAPFALLSLAGLIAWRIGRARGRAVAERQAG